MQGSVNKEVHACECCEDIKKVVSLLQRVIVPILPIIQGNTNKAVLMMKLPQIIQKVSSQLKEEDVRELLLILSKYENQGI